LIGLLYTTGLRIGEALNLTLRDLDLKRRVIEVREGKFHKSRYVPLSFSAARQMKKYLHQRRGAGFSMNPTGAGLPEHHRNPARASGLRDTFFGTAARPGLRGPKANRGLASMTCATPSPCIVCWRSIGRMPISQPNFHYSRPIWGTARSPAPKSTSRPRRNYWNRLVGVFMPGSPYHPPKPNVMTTSDLELCGSCCCNLLPGTTVKTCASLMLTDLKADTVGRFLDYLERERHNAVSTRNNRLAAIHAFFHYVAQTDRAIWPTANPFLRSHSSATPSACPNTWSDRKS
jgi:hypothetical protein